MGLHSKVYEILIKFYGVDIDFIVILDCRK